MSKRYIHLRIITYVNKNNQYSHGVTHLLNIISYDTWATMIIYPMYNDVNDDDNFLKLSVLVYEQLLTNGCDGNLKKKQTINDICKNLLSFLDIQTLLSR